MTEKIMQDGEYGGRVIGDIHLVNDLRISKIMLD